MDIELLAAFWAVSIALVMTPGADWAYAISAGMRGRVILPAVGGMLLGYLVVTLVVAAGIGALVTSIPGLLDVLTFLGSAYLLWLGVGVLRHPPVPTAGLEQYGTPLGWAVRGLAISGMNPKALLLFLALLPQFTNRAATWPVAGQIAAMGLIQIVNCALVYSLVAIGARAVLRARPKAARLVGQVSGMAMIAIAIFIITDRFVV